MNFAYAANVRELNGILWRDLKRSVPGEITLVDNFFCVKSRGFKVTMWRADHKPIWVELRDIV